MFYKISNTASRISIEEKFHISFEFPNLYKPQYLIDGLKESTITVITSSHPKMAVYAIWGLLPESFEDNWSVFQDVVNTLNVKLETLENSKGFYSDLLQNRRCIIIATGFFTTWLANGTIERCHVHLPNYEPFAIAGVFNELSDGFITCSLVVTNISESFKDVPNISNLKPLVLNDSEIKQWCDKSASLNQIKKMCANHRSLKFEFEIYEPQHSELHPKR